MSGNEQFEPFFASGGCFSERFRSVFASNFRVTRQFDASWASSGLDPCLLQINQPLQVVAAGLHSHREVCASLTDGANELAAHLFNAGKDVLDTCAGFGNAMVASLLAFRQRLVCMAFALDVIAIAVLFQLCFTRFGRVAPVGVDGPAGIG